MNIDREIMGCSSSALFYSTQNYHLLPLSITTNTLKPPQHTPILETRRRSLQLTRKKCRLTNQYILIQISHRLKNTPFQSRLSPQNRFMLRAILLPPCLNIHRILIRIHNRRINRIFQLTGYQCPIPVPSWVLSNDLKALAIVKLTDCFTLVFYTVDDDFPIHEGLGTVFEIVVIL